MAKSRYGNKETLQDTLKRETLYYYTLILQLNRLVDKTFNFFYGRRDLLRVPLK